MFSVLIQAYIRHIPTGYMRKCPACMREVTETVGHLLLYCEKICPFRKVFGRIINRNILDTPVQRQARVNVRQVFDILRVDVTVLAAYIWLVKVRKHYTLCEVEALMHLALEMGIRYYAAVVSVLLGRE